MTCNLFCFTSSIILFEIAFAFLEEEAVARTLLDKLNIIGDDKSGHYMFDRDILAIAADSGEAPQ